MYGMDEDSFKDMLMQQSENSIKVQLALEAVAEKEGLQVTEEAVSYTHLIKISFFSKNESISGIFI